MGNLISLVKSVAFFYYIITHCYNSLITRISKGGRFSVSFDCAGSYAILPIELFTRLKGRLEMGSIKSLGLLKDIKNGE